MQLSSADPSTDLIKISMAWSDPWPNRVVPMCRSGWMMAATAPSRARRCAKVAVASGKVVSIGRKSTSVRAGLRAGHSKLLSAVSDRGGTRFLRVRRRQISRTALIIKWLAEVKLKRNWSGILPLTAFSNSVSSPITQSQHSWESCALSSVAELARSSGRQQLLQIMRSGPRGGAANRHWPAPHALHWSSSGHLCIWQKPAAAITQICRICAGRPAAKSSARHRVHQEIRSLGAGPVSSGRPRKNARFHAAKSCPSSEHSAQIAA